jgi:galactose mutarotase-like enzyme
LYADLRPSRCVLALEPCTSDRLPDGHSAPNTPLQPGESRRYRLDLEFAPS